MPIQPYPFRYSRPPELLPKRTFSADHNVSPQLGFGRREASATSMATLDRKDLDHLERRELHLTVIAAVFVFVLASGLAVFMYPQVFVHPDAGNKWTMRVAFFGFCALILL